MPNHERVLHKLQPPVRDHGPFGVMTVADECRVWLALPVWRIKAEAVDDRVVLVLEEHSRAGKTSTKGAEAPPLRRFRFSVGPEDDLVTVVYRTLKRRRALELCRFCKEPMRVDDEPMGMSVQTYLCTHCGWRKMS